MYSVPSAWLIHEFDYLEYEGKNNMQESVFKEAQKVQNVRVDFSKVYGVGAKQEQIVADAVIFCYAEHTTPFLDFKEQSKVIIKGKEYVIQSTVPVDFPDKKGIFAYELEVI